MIYFGRYIKWQIEKGQLKVDSVFAELKRLGAQEARETNRMCAPTTPPRRDPVAPILEVPRRFGRGRGDIGIETRIGPVTVLHTVVYTYVHPEGRADQEPAAGCARSLVLVC